jgi:hypothetical protein
MALAARQSAEELLSSIRTIGDALDAIQELFLRQIDRAEVENTPPNEPCEGDTAARDSFLTILPIPDQRALFLTMARQFRFLPRIRTLVGSPPYPFLRQEDDAVLRPAGITRGRSHMAVAGSDISSYASFGSAQFLDGSTRDFKIVGKHLVSNHLISGQSLMHRRNLELPFINLASGDGVVLEVRIKKRSLQRKLEIARGRGDVAREAVLFPRAGSTLNLQPTRRLRAVTGDLSVRINAVQPRSTDGNVARLICRVA